MLKFTSMLIKSIDIFGAEFQLYVQKNTSINTVLGGIFSILTFGFFLFTFILFGNDFYYKKNPNVISREKLYTKEELYRMNNQTVNDLPLVLIMSKRFSEEHYFIVDANVPYTFQNEKLYDLVRPCNESYVLENFYPDAKDIGRDEIENSVTYLCYDMSQYKFGLNGNGAGRGSELINFLNIWTTKCRTDGKKKKNQNIPCPSNYDPLKPWDDSPELKIWTKEILYNPDNISKPFESTWTQIAFMYMSLYSETQFFYYLLETTSVDDTGFILESNTLISQFGVGKVELINLLKDEPKSFYDLTIRIGFDKMYKEYSRRYMKIQDLLALVGGILKAVITFFTIITIPYNEHHLIQYLKKQIEKSNESETIKKGLNIKKDNANSNNFEKIKTNDINNNINNINNESKCERSEQDLKESK